MLTGLAWKPNSEVGATDATYTAYLVKTDADGVLEWERVFRHSDTTQTWLSDIIQAHDGSYLVLGDIFSDYASMDFERTVYLFRVDEDGNRSWERSLSWGNSYNRAGNLLRTPDDTYLFTGFTRENAISTGKAFLVEVDLQGHVLRELPLALDHPGLPGSVFAITEAGYAMAGTYHNTETDSSSVVLAEIDPKGDLLWAQSFAVSFVNYLQATALTIDGGYLLANLTIPRELGSEAPSYVYLIKTDAQGHPVWERVFNEEQGEPLHDVQDVVATPDGGAAFVGSRAFAPFTSLNFLLAETDSTGALRSVQEFGTGHHDYVEKILLTNDISYVVAGSRLLPELTSRIFLAKIAPALPTATTLPGMVTPRRALLDAAYPNPFRTATHIRLHLREAGYVSLKIYDVLGRIVATLLEGHLPPQVHVLTWEAAGLAEGVYFGRVEHAGRTEIVKLTLRR